MTGRVEEVRPNLRLAAMSDEQKESEALRLVSDIVRLQSLGVVQPCRVQGGRPVPLEHVLQLSEHAMAQEPSGRTDHDESDDSDLSEPD